jgi:putative membrane protein
MLSPNLLLAILIAPLVAWSAWEPYDTITWWMEVTPVFLGFIALFVAEKRNWRLSNLALGLIAFHMIVLLVGGHYTYARVPAGAWVSEMFGLTRNHYDRLGHLTQGFVPAILCREVFLRNHVTKGAWLGFCVFSFCLAFSATYELIEWLAAIISAEAAESFLGTQGDSWDTQWDMFLAATGALLALVSLSRSHDRSLDRLLATSPWARKRAA